MLSNSTRIAGIYIIRLSPSHYYGGRSINCHRRWGEHLRDLKSGTHCNNRMQAVYNIYGRFEPEVVIPWSDGTNLKDLEQRWLDDNFRKPGCVNLTRTSDKGGNVWSEESRKKASHTHKTKPGLLEKHKEKLDQIRPLANAAATAFWTPEAKQRLAEKNRSRTGIPQKPESVAKRAASLRGRKNTPEAKARMSVSAKARCVAHPTAHSEETRSLISSQQKGRVWLHNEVINRRVWPSDAQEFIAQGWLPDRLPNKISHT